MVMSTKGPTAANHRHKVPRKKSRFHAVKRYRPGGFVEATRSGGLVLGIKAVGSLSKLDFRTSKASPLWPPP